MFLLNTTTNMGTTVLQEYFFAVSVLLILLEKDSNACIFLSAVMEQGSQGRMSKPFLASYL